LTDQRQLYWLQNLARHWGLGDVLTGQRALLYWATAVGPRVAQFTRPLYVDGTTLHIAVASSVVANELRMMEETLLRRLDAHGAPPLRHLRFHTRSLTQSDIASPPELEVRWEDEQAAEAVIPHEVSGTLRAIAVRNAARAHARERSLLARGGRRCARCGVVFCGREAQCDSCRHFSPWGWD